MADMMDCPACWGAKPACKRCKGAGKLPDRLLAPHFKLSELVNSPTARKLGLSNDPTPEIEGNLERLCVEALEPIRQVVGPLRINSGYRSDAVNKAVGGSTTSAHSYGLAADLNPVKMDWKRLMDAIIATGIKLDQLIYEHTWVHVGLAHPKFKKQRNQTLTMFKVDGKPVYEPYNPEDERLA